MEGIINAKPEGSCTIKQRRPLSSLMSLNDHNVSRNKKVGSQKGERKWKNEDDEETIDGARKRDSEKRMVMMMQKKMDKQNKIENK